MNTYFVTAVAALAAALPHSGVCASLDDALHCNVSAHTFIGSLIDAGQIEPRPTRVESNYINAFDLVKGADLHAFGYPVFAIVGYQEGDPIFRKGSGTRLSTSAYGAVVWGSAKNVKAAVDAAHSNAIVHRVAPFITAIFCDRD